MSKNTHCGLVLLQETLKRMHLEEEMDQYQLIDRDGACVTNFGTLYI